MLSSFYFPEIFVIMLHRLFHDLCLDIIIQICSFSSTRSSFDNIMHPGFILWNYATPVFLFIASYLRIFWTGCFEVVFPLIYWNSSWFELSCAAWRGVIHLLLLSVILICCQIRQLTSTLTFLDSDVVEYYFILLTFDPAWWVQILHAVGFCHVKLNTFLLPSERMIRCLWFQPQRIISIFNIFRTRVCYTSYLFLNHNFWCWLCSLFRIK